MGLILNSFNTMHRVGGNIISRFIWANAHKQPYKENFNAFGQYVSMPQGYQDTRKAIIPSVKESSNIRAWIQGSGDLLNTGIQVPMTMLAIIAGVGTLVPDAEVGKTLGATITGVGTFGGDSRMAVTLAATLDAGVRPSAFDIAQEVWNSQKTAYIGIGTMGEVMNSMDAAALAEAILTDPRFLSVAKYLGLK